MSTAVFTLILGLGFAVRLWAAVELRRMQATDPKFAQALRQARLEA
jgi:hypothetical protein